MLVHSDPEGAKNLLALGQQDVNERWKLYEKLAAAPPNGGEKTEAPVAKPVDKEVNA